ncbi:transmembrane protein 74 [Amblyraja radiata]|uniref:transmembrane protein 74 n=1 Tax=Amblyraja radiata TaxID=386614 RepID=UPI001403C423|nr:transmembrane protein 74 [Amblyraja radiata]
MTSVELCFLGQERAFPRPWKELGWGLHGSEPRSSSSAPGTALFQSVGCKPARPDSKICCDQQPETSFTYVDENVNLQRACSPLSHGNCNPPCYQSSYGESRPSPDELSVFSDDSSSEDSDSPVDYGFICALLFLCSGIALVIISYVIPRDVTVDPDSVSAREMERLQRQSARIGAHLDRCVIAGLGLLTLGGMLLSTLLMISICKGQLYRRQRFSLAGRSGKIYGSFNFRLGSPNQRFSLGAEELVAID